MTFRTHAIAAALAATFSATAVYAGDNHAPAAPTFQWNGGDLLVLNDQADAWRKWAEDFSNEMRTSMGTMFSSRVGSSRVVKNAPYSAEVVTENNQALSDGNVITKRTSSRVYRDAQGRTREEVGGDGKTPAIYINDPVTSQRIILSPGSKRAVVTPRSFGHSYSYDSKNKQVMSMNGTEIRIEDGKVFVDGKEVSGKIEINAGGKAVKVDGIKVTVDGKDVFDVPKITVRKVTTAETGDGPNREEVRVQIVRNGDSEEIYLAPPAPPRPPAAPMPGVAPLAPLAPVPPLPGASVMRFDSVGKLGKGVTTDLGSKDIEGVRSEGRKTVWTIPAGEIGNKAPINVVSETWYAPDLQVTMYSRYADPRQGESIYRLAGVKRSEPSADLFSVPEGYEKMSKDAERAKAQADRDKERAERDRQRALKQLERDQQRLDQERERLQRERERLKG
ncbi:hypothetical protein DSM104443_02931 [Usitatibacter rugosus]|uniref:Uncharacterized protein n=1 Tax=Usitatibacter rugosus TaxID=2732067 RepID=A0A6M4GY63_9PROT|nr:hypothetical protein [Usitatibacter rugosus]QJR11848.1 hypothetical protein DSM104443_02931 [Usitatibacter rugosus]